LKAKMFCEFFDSEEKQERTAWSFLGGMARPKDFSLSRPRCETARNLQVLGGNEEPQGSRRKRGTSRF